MDSINQNKLSRSKLYLFGVLLLFFIVYSLISFVDHYMFRTYNLDLAMFNQAIYDFAHFRMNYFTLGTSEYHINYFGDHFSPITLLYSPFYYIFGSYTLLVIQVFSILFGGFGTYKIAKQNNLNDKNALLILSQFFLFWGIYSALAFDFHNNVVGAMFVPWIIYFYYEKKTRYFILFYILFIITKENMALWIAFIFIGIILKDFGFKFKKYPKDILILIAFSFVYFVVISGIVMPYISEGKGFNQFDRYDHLGQNVPEILRTLIKRPKYAFSLFFEDVTETGVAGYKSELYFAFLLSGGLLTIRRPVFLLMLLPIFAQKMLTKDSALWGVGNQYSIEFIPILSWAIIDFVKEQKQEKNKFYASLGAMLMTGILTFHLMDAPNYYLPINNLRFYQERHYTREDLSVKKLYKTLESIPDDAAISVCAELGAHLAFREKIYHFPYVADAEYVLILKKPENYHPFPNKESYFHGRDSLLKSPFWKLKSSENNLIIMTKVK